MCRENRTVPPENGSASFSCNAFLLLPPTRNPHSPNTCSLQLHCPRSPSHTRFMGHKAAGLDLIWEDGKEREREEGVGERGRAAETQILQLNLSC